MKKLNKKLRIIANTIEAYTCSCPSYGCSCVSSGDLYPNLWANQSEISRHAN